MFTFLSNTNKKQTYVTATRCKIGLRAKITQPLQVHRFFFAIIAYLERILHIRGLSDSIFAIACRICDI